MEFLTLSIIFFKQKVMKCKKTVCCFVSSSFFSIFAWLFCILLAFISITEGSRIYEWPRYKLSIDFSEYP